MRTSTQSIFIGSLVLVSQITLTAAQPDLVCLNCSNTNGNYASSSIYSKNLKTLLSIISSNTQIHNGFYKFSVGQGPDRVNGLAVCRADRSLADCKSCVSDATERLSTQCPVQKEASGYYYGDCMLRYSNRPILIQENFPQCQSKLSPQDIPDTDLRKFAASRAILLEELKRGASAGNSSYKFKSGVKEVAASLKVYGLAQCNPDLSSFECSDCLGAVIMELQQCCSNYNGVGSYGPICSVVFWNRPLITDYTNSSQQPILPATPIRSGERNSSNKVWIIIVSVVSFLLIVAAMFGLSKRMMRNKLKQGGNDQIKLIDSLQLDFSSIQFATDNFSDDKRLGSSATPMYKGVLPDGQEIAVKKLHKGGRDGGLEFDNEVLLSVNFQHKNLVKLLGFCIEKDVRVLVYEFLPNGSLHDFLNDPVKRASLDWETRYSIISGFARGLLYLHEDSQIRVIHRDLKPSNILLGIQMDSKISNFRTASFIGADQTKGDTGVVGTYGYMPVEYVRHGHCSTKSDIFSFGVLLLEIITGSMITGFSDGEKQESLLTYAWRQWCDRNALDVVDQVLADKKKHVKQIKRCIQIGLLCVQEDPRQRPTMSTVVLMLTSDTVDVPEPMKPAPLILNNMDLHSECQSSQTDKSHESSLNEASISSVEPR